MRRQGDWAAGQSGIRKKRLSNNYTEQSESSDDGIEIEEDAGERHCEKVVNPSHPIIAHQG